MSLFRRKTVESLQAAVESDKSLKRALGPVNLTALGIGAIIGAGIFVLTGQAAAQYAGPAIVISFIVAGVACAFAGLCYAEFSAMIPISGSAYTYGYATLGEFVAWIIGWDLILEYLFAASTVAVGWSGYVMSLLYEWKIQIIPPGLSAAPGTHLIEISTALAAALKTRAGWTTESSALLDQIKAAGTDAASLGHVTAAFNLPALFIILVISALLVVGIKESATFNNIIVAIKLLVILTFIAVGVSYINQANWHPFVPERAAGQFGWLGVLRAAGVIFFAYIGFDAVSTAAQEAKNPQRNMPIGILGSLTICTVLYIVVSLILTGMVSYKELNVPAPIAVAVDSLGPSISKWLSPIIKIGAIAGLSSVILVMLLGQPRIFYTMSKDGLLPPMFSAVHPKFRTPWLATILTGLVAMLVAGLFPISILGELVSIGTLLAFAIVCAGIFVLRFTDPEIHRPFRTPVFWLVAPLGVISCVALMVFLPLDTWLRLIIWMAIGFVIYFGYGRRHSKARPEASLPKAAE